MGKIVITTNVSLDGVVQDPDGQEGFRQGGWFGRFGGKDLEAWTALETDEALGAAALLLGRRSDDWFASRWNGRSGEWADKLNSMPKYIVSATLGEPKWRNGVVLNGDVMAQISKLKQEVDGEILVYASYQLGRALLEHDLWTSCVSSSSRSCSASGSDSSARPATASPYVSSVHGRSGMASPSSTTRLSSSPLVPPRSISCQMHAVRTTAVADGKGS
jgi:dihydrofolate reductase